MNVYQSVFFFGIPGLLIYLGAHFLAPFLEASGFPSIWTWFLIIWIPISVLFLIVLISFFKKPNREPFTVRFRLRALTKREISLIVGAFVVIQALELVLSSTGRYLSQFAFFAIPDALPELFNPAFNIEEGLTRFFAYPTYGNWWLLGYWLLWLTVNIGGEELLWRGYALPLQEKAIGKWAWLVNGLCWNLLVHFFMNWNFIALMPISLLIPYLVQKYQNTWIGIYIHGIGNLMIFALLIPAIMTPPG